MILPVVPFPTSDVSPDRPAAQLSRVPLALVAAAGVGLAAAGVMEGSLPLLVAGAGLWFASGYAWERLSGSYRAGV